MGSTQDARAGQNALLEVLFASVEHAPLADLDAVLEAYRAERQKSPTPFDAAIAHGRKVDRLGWAFVGAYSAALETLVPGVSGAALCVTEEEGNHPRAIKAELRAAADGFELSGLKTFVTFGAKARDLLVVAREGESDGRPQLAVCRIPSDRDGIEMAPGPETPFVPEIPHTRVSLRAVRVANDERLPGDGYLNYVKPFRTVEDIHVVAGTLAYLHGVATRASVAEAAALFVGPILALRELVVKPPLDARVHVALHGLLRTATYLAESAHMSAAWSALGDEDEHVRWKRDAVLMQVASGARKARFAKAVESLGLK